jgi:hypothetical protein
MASRSTKEVPMDQTIAPAGNEAQNPVPVGPDFLEGFVAEEDYATRRGVSIRTCQRDRQLQQSPPYVVMGRRVYYRVAAIREWLLARERRDVQASGRTVAATPARIACDTDVGGVR